MQLTEFYASPSDQQKALDALTFGLNLAFPVGNVVRALLVGLNVCGVTCRNGAYISYGGSMSAYGAPILYLCIQTTLVSLLLLWLDRGGVSASRGHHNSKGDQELAIQVVRPEVADETSRATTSKSDLIGVLGVTKCFGPTTAVDDVTFGIRSSEILALLGPNGAGKSTLFDLIRGQSRPDRGRILLQGSDVTTQPQLAVGKIGGKNGPSYGGHRN